MPEKRKVVPGLGNLLQKDEGFGIQPEELSTGIDLSPAVQAVSEEVVQRGIEILHGW